MADRTQGTDLPMGLKDSLESITKLKGMKGLRVWKYDVQCALEFHNLSDLIDSLLPQLQQTDSTYENWWRLSRKVSMWLGLQIKVEVKEQLVLELSKDGYTDKTYKLILKLIK